MHVFASKNPIKILFSILHTIYRFCMWFPGDKLVGEASRLVVAEACIQAMDIEFTENQIYEINSVKVNYLIWHSCT